MKRSQAFPGNFLAKDDVAAPILATIANVRSEAVTCEHGKENKPVMKFTADQMKPLILNLVNWQACEDAYGPDSDEWCGRAVEIYVDPNVMFGAKRVGGIRLRIPARAPVPAAPPASVPAITAGSAPRPGAPTSPAPPPTAPKPPPPIAARQAAPAATTAPKPAQPPTLAQRHAQLLAGYAGARTQGKVKEWEKWGTGFPWTPEMDDEQSDAFHAAMERTAPPPEQQPSSARRATPARA